jgi:hypothetical protein
LEAPDDERTDEPLTLTDELPEVDFTEPPLEFVVRPIPEAEPEAEPVVLTAVPFV